MNQKSVATNTGLGFIKTIKLLVAGILIGNFMFGCISTGAVNVATPISVNKTQEELTPGLNAILLTPIPTDTEIGQNDGSPEGTLIFACLYGIYQYDLKSKEFLTLINDETRIYSNIGVFGRKIYFLRTTDRIPQKSPSGGQFGPDDIFSMEMDGSHLEQVTTDEFYDFNLSVSSSTGKLIFVSDKPTGNARRYKAVLLNPENGEQKVIAESNDQFFPIWSPDGNKVALFESSLESGKTHRLFLFDVHQEKLTELIPGENILSTKLAWSPNEQQVIVGIMIEGKPGLGLIDVKTETISKIVQIDDEPRNFAWSVDGKLILFETRNISNSANPLAKLWLFDIASEKTTALYEGDLDSRRFSYNAIWSPDSKYIAFFTNPGGVNLELNIQNIKTSDRSASEISCTYADRVLWITSPE